MMTFGGEAMHGHLLKIEKCLAFEFGKLGSISDKYIRKSEKNRKAIINIMQHNISM